MPGIGVILNPHSRLNVKDPDRIDRLGFIVGDRGSCHATKSLEDVRKLALEFKSRGVEVIGISGGDGTYQRTLTTLIQAYGESPLPKIALLGGGTMNNIVKCLKIKGTPETVLSRLIYRYHQGSPFKETRLKMMKVNDIYGFLFGNGLLYNFLCDYNKVEHSTPWTAARLLAVAACHALLNDRRAQKIAQRVEARLLVDGREHPFKNFVTIFGGTVETLGLGFNVLYRARSTEDKFQLSGFSLPPRQIIFSFPLLFLGRKVPSENWIDELASRVTIETEEPQGFMLDGEVYEPVRKIELSIGKILDVIVG
ncbi:MAG: diacylglycerol kinase family protein [Deltaproteobacteria bacterium]|nr:diacylglycerol kinase family protein [Deltaproteobacteria bacterium]